MMILQTFMHHNYEYNNVIKLWQICLFPLIEAVFDSKITGWLLNQNIQLIKMRLRRILIN